MHFDCFIKLTESKEIFILLGLVSFYVLQKVEEKLLFYDASNMTVLIFLCWPKAGTQNVKLEVNFRNSAVNPRQSCLKSRVHKFCSQN